MDYCSIFLKCFVGAFGLVSGVMCAVIAVLKCVDWLTWYFNYSNKYNYDWSEKKKKTLKEEN